MLAKNTSVNLGPHFLAFAERQVRDGRYSSTSDVIRAGLRLLEEREEALAALRKALEEGEASGPLEPWDLEEFLTEMRSTDRAAE